MYLLMWCGFQHLMFQLRGTLSFAGLPRGIYLPRYEEGRACRGQLQVQYTGAGETNVSCGL